MKTKSTPSNICIKALIALYFFVGSMGLTAQKQETSDLKHFKIVIENTDNGLKLQSLKGCAWIDLSFSLKNYNLQYKDEYGMAEKDGISTVKDASIADFLITIKKTKDGITLQGIEGTAWKELSFSFAKNGKQVIDQFGMSE